MTMMLASMLVVLLVAMLVVMPVLMLIHQCSRFGNHLQQGNELV